MKQLQTQGIVLSRTDYGEADRIVTILTPEQGKITLMARGVRKPKSKLAGGIELFSTSDVSYIKGRGEIGTLISVRLLKHYGNIVQDIDRVQLGYEVIKIINKATEDQPEEEYFQTLEQAFMALNDSTIDRELIKTWYFAQLLRLSGHSPNLSSTIDGNKLTAGTKYNFDYEDVSFIQNDNGTYLTDDIKYLRLLFSGNQPKILSKVEKCTQLNKQAQPLVQTMLQTYIRL